MKELINILSEQFKVQPSDNEVRKWLNEKIPFKSTYILKTEERARNWDFINKFMENGEQPLQLGYFVPCNEKGEVLEEPNINDRQYIFELHDELLGNPIIHDEEKFEVDLEEYQKAKESVIYKGYAVEMIDKDENIYFHNGSLWYNKEESLELGAVSRKTISDMEGQPITKQFWTF